MTRPEILLTTKLQPPPMRPDLVPRPRLLAKLNRALACRVTLLTAPPGFGKTTLVRAWLASNDHAAGWLSLEAADNSPERFLVYLIEAGRGLDPALGSEALALLRAAHRPHLPSVLTILVNDLAALPRPGLIVLDDYHLVEEPAIHQALDFLIANLPAQIHLILTSRSQPPLSLARLRGQAQLLELTSAELRFTSVEVDTFLNRIMQLNLSAAERNALDMRTEGWIAGLQLAGLSLQTQADKAAFIAAFSGTDRTISDYLFEEVLQQQPAEIRRFLLATALVERLSGDLAEAILDQPGGQAMLERLEAAQLFIGPLDNQRQWYRYHPLFADLLRQQLQRTTSPTEIQTLHRRAGHWFAQQGQLDEAIQHGLAAQEFAWAADLIEAAFQQNDWIRPDMPRLLAWFEALPDSVTSGRPNLHLGLAWLLFEIFSDQWGRIETHLAQVENILRQSEEVGAFSDAEIGRILASVDVLRANQARQAGEPERVIALCRQALARLPEEELYIRSGTIAHLASAYESLGDLAQADRLYRDSLSLCRTAHNVDGLLFAAAHLIEVLRVSGELREAEAVFQQVQGYAETRSGPDMGLVYLNLGQVYREQNRLELAKTYLVRGLKLCRPFAAWQAGVGAGLRTLARVLAAEGQVDEALKSLADIEPATAVERSQLEATQARLWLVQGDVRAAANWVNHRGLVDKPEFDAADEFEQLTLVRVLIAQARLESQSLRTVKLAAPHPAEQALDLLARLHRVALAGSRVGSVIEIRLLQALTLTLRQESAEALASVAEAVNLAEPAGVVRLFVDEGGPAYQLLIRLLSRSTMAVSPAFVQQLLAAFPVAAQPASPADSLPGTSLTERELETLRLLATTRSIEEIATELSVSVSTVRTYSKRIYSKLEAHSRAEAIYQAQALQLL